MAEVKPMTPAVVSEGNKVPTWLIIILGVAILGTVCSGAVSFLMWKQLGRMSGTVTTLSADLTGARSETADLTQKLATAQAVQEQFKKQVEEKLAAQAAALATPATASAPATTTPPAATYTPPTPYVPSYTSPYTGTSGSSSKKHKGTSGTSGSSSKKKSSKKNS